LRRDVLVKWPIPDTLPAPVKVEAQAIKPRPSQTPLVQHRRRGAKSGPKPKEWAETLQNVFERQHERLVDMSQRERHRHVLTYCTDLTGRPGSNRTTELH
jgi:hypothetical protein